MKFWITDSIFQLQRDILFVFYSFYWLRETNSITIDSHLIQAFDINVSGLVECGEMMCVTEVGDAFFFLNTLCISQDGLHIPLDRIHVLNKL